MKFTKRLVALMLSLVMVFGAVPSMNIKGYANETQSIVINGLIAGSVYNKGGNDFKLQYLDSQGIHDFYGGSYIEKIYSDGVELEDGYVLEGGESYIIEGRIGDTDSMNFDFIRTGQGSCFECNDNSLEYTDGGLEPGKYTFDGNTFKYYFQIEITLSTLSVLDFEYGPLNKSAIEEYISNPDSIQFKNNSTNIDIESVEDVSISRMITPDNYFLAFAVVFDDLVMGPENLRESEHRLKFYLNGVDVLDNITSIQFATEDKLEEAILANKTVVLADSSSNSYIVYDLVRFEEPKVTRTKKYKASTTTGSGEKISGSGKKNSTRTITPIEGKKVLNVTAIDKKGNVVEVTQNEDGTYSYIQPASDVTINIEYAKREVALNINTTEVNANGVTTNNDVKPIKKEGSTYLPLRVVAEGLGFEVKWNANEPNIVELYRSNEETYKLYLDQYYLEYANQMMNYEKILTVENNRTFVEENALGKLLGATISTSSENPNQIIVTEE